MNYRTRLITLALALFFLFGILSLSACKNDYKALGAEDLLRVENAELVNQKGETVLLQGVNLGGWLVQEHWMCPVLVDTPEGIDEWGELDSYKALSERGFSQEQIDTLFESYRNNWITEVDLKNLADSGANVVRVPFWYRNFMRDTAGTWIAENPDENPGFKHLDWIIETAGKYGIYVVLDMHGCPGGQSQNHSTGTLGMNELYGSEENRATMEKLWVAIAARYKDSPVVAAYDIMNEPQNNDSKLSWEKNYYDPWNSSSWKLTNEVYQQMIPAIREQDPTHIISVEAVWRIGNLPNPIEVGWENMLYQLHLYDSTNVFADNVVNLKRATEAYGVAGYVGEFYNLDGMSICAKTNISYCTWSYKGVNTEYNDTFFHYYSDIEPADLNQDSYETILEKWGENLRSEHFTRNDSLLNRFAVAQKTAK